MALTFDPAKDAANIAKHGVSLAKAHQATPNDDIDLTDAENPEWTEQMFARAHGPESLSEAELAAFPTTRETLVRQGKLPISIRLDADILAYFKAGGVGWQTRINRTLRQAMK